MKPGFGRLLPACVVVFCCLHCGQDQPTEAEEDGWVGVYVGIGDLEAVAPTGSKGLYPDRPVSLAVDREEITSTYSALRLVLSFRDVDFTEKAVSFPYRDHTVRTHSAVEVGPDTLRASAQIGDFQYTIHLVKENGEVTGRGEGGRAMVAETTDTTLQWSVSFRLSRQE